MISRILFVCTGNTCRRCMAETIARAESEKMGVLLSFSSAGIYAVKGTSASYNALMVMEEMGYDLSCHIAKPLNLEIAEDSELILAMTGAHKKAVINAFPSIADKVFTLMEYIGEQADIDDPFGGDITVYRQVASSLKIAINKLIHKIMES